jgi:hypothetical protein
MQLQASDKFYMSKAFETFLNYCRLIEETIEEGKAASVFRPTINSRVFRNMFFGVFIHRSMRWCVLRESAQVDKAEEIEQVTELLASRLRPTDDGYRVSKDPGSRAFLFSWYPRKDSRVSGPLNPTT